MKFDVRRLIAALFIALAALAAPTMTTPAEAQAPSDYSPVKVASCVTGYVCWIVQLSPTEVAACNAANGRGGKQRDCNHWWMTSKDGKVASEKIPSGGPWVICRPEGYPNLGYHAIPTREHPDGRRFFVNFPPR